MNSAWRTVRTTRRSRSATTRPRTSPSHFRVRERSEDPHVGDDGTVRSTWRPWPDVEITTWLAPAAPWHLRTHRIRTGRALHTVEAGFAVDREPALASSEAGAGLAVAVSAAGDLSGLRDLASPESGQPPREGRVIQVLPGTNVLARRTALPVLTVRLGPGEHWVRCAVLGTTPQGSPAWDVPPS